MFSDRGENSSLMIDSLTSAVWTLMRRRSVRIALVLIVLVIVWVG